ncbi:MAG TPA: cation diffusion facilitator family transporter [Nocardioidaceae bacterium]|nr:cation diffusion facilitator family transporter [Nocardioidaceae bacterium]
MSDRQPADSQQIPSWTSAFVQGVTSAARRSITRREDDVDGSIRTVAVAFLANVVVAAAKYGAFFLSGSSSILAEALHSTSVTVNQALLLRGRLSSMHPPTRLHPFGFGLARYFWAFVVSVVIFGIGAILSFLRGLLALGAEGHEIHTPWVPYAALTVGLVMDGSSFLVAMQQAKREKGDLSYWQYIKRSRNPEVPMVMLEDSAAIVGLAFAYTGVTLTLLTGNALYDAIGSICIGLLLATVSFVMAREMKSLLLGESATPEQEQEIRAVLTGHDAVRDVIYFRSLYLGPDSLLVEAKVAFPDDMRFPEIAEAIDSMEAAIRERVAVAQAVSIEPGVAEPHDVDVPGYQSDRGPDGYGRSD